MRNESSRSSIRPLAAILAFLVFQALNFQLSHTTSAQLKKQAKIQRKQKRATLQLGAKRRPPNRKTKASTNHELWDEGDGQS